MSGSTETFQLSTQAAEAYEQRFVPALLAEWAGYLVDAAGVASGQSVLDVACGTGIVARTAAERMNGLGRVVGLDVNEGMLAVARLIRPEVEWHHGDAGDLPFPDASFDTVLCQAALMFFPARVRALEEMGRVVTPEGTVAVQVWGRLESQPGYRPFADVAARQAGPHGRDVVSSYFCLGDLDLVSGLFDEAGLVVTATATRMGAVRFASIDEFVRAEIDSSPLVDRIDDDVYARILEDCRHALGEFRTGDGRAEIPVEGHVLTARRR